MTKEEAKEEFTIHAFHDMLYYVIVTLTSVGYGDISPNTLLGKYLMIIFFVNFFTFLQREVSDFSKVNSLSSEYSRVVYIKSKSDTQHILLLGDS
mmetsp:Transcript_13235/g.20668  ORF Transcript_13235/g.20668 Transcript_13235/m.20668 type:complete len:95 (-) Transcript_13235:2444-2728(-)